MQPTYIDAYTRQFSLCPATTALLIVDVQYASGSRQHGLGKLLGAREHDIVDELRPEPGELVLNKTTIEACDRQYGVVLVSDATGTCSDEMRAAADRCAAAGGR